MATLEDAIAALSDPELRGMGDTRDGLVPMNGFKVLGRLQELGATEEEARALVVEALVELGGVDRSEWRERRGLRPGRAAAAAQWVPDYWVPESQLRGGG